MTAQPMSLGTIVAQNLGIRTKVVMRDRVKSPTGRPILIKVVRKREPTQQVIQMVDATTQTQRWSTMQVAHHKARI